MLIYAYISCLFMLRVSQRSAEKRKKVQEWMAKKRKERLTEWKSHLEDLRSTEFKPFTGTNEVFHFVSS